jgi:hypothetical protein
MKISSYSEEFLYLDSDAITTDVSNVWLEVPSEMGIT